VLRFPSLRSDEKDAADRLVRSGSEQQVEVIAHQAVAEQPKRIAALRLPQGVEESLEVGGRREHGRTVVAAADGMVEQAVGDGSRQARHEWRLTKGHAESKRK
jgi:hypothetical protein